MAVWFSHCHLYFQPEMQIQLLKRSEIDEEKWNLLVEKHGNGFPYAFSWYLDIVALKQWSALVADNYKAILPFCWNRKFGIPQIYHPSFTQQLGIISGQAISQEDFLIFLNGLPKKYWRIQMTFNFKNQFDHHNFRKRANYCLSLSYPFEKIEENFAKNLNREINRAKKLGLKIGKPLSLNEHLNHFQKQMAIKKVKISAQRMEILQQLLKTCLEKKKGLIKTVYGQNGEVLASTFLLDSPTRIINLILWSNLKGKQQFASHFLLSEIMLANANQDKVFDFEGSNIQTIAFFNRKFGAVDVPYLLFEKERFPINLIRKLKS